MQCSATRWKSQPTPKIAVVRSLPARRSTAQWLRLVKVLVASFEGRHRRK